MELNQLYFYTATIVEWKKLLKPDKYKQVIVDSLHYLSQKQKIAVYGFVIMPNHIHLIWEILAKNGKEMPHASFMKYTSHVFLEDLQKNHLEVLALFEKDEATVRKHQFWQRNSLAIWIYTPAVIEQKLNYIHANPVAEKWNLAEEPQNYHYSSAKFYETGVDDFGFLKHYGERI